MPLKGKWGSNFWCTGSSVNCCVRHHFDEKLSKAYVENCLKARPLFQNCEQKIKFVRGSDSQKFNIFSIIKQNKKQNKTKKKLTGLISENYPPPPLWNFTPPKNLQCLFWPLLEFLKAILSEKGSCALYKGQVIRFNTALYVQIYKLITLVFRLVILSACRYMGKVSLDIV